MSLDLPHLPLDTGSKYHICAEFIQWESVGRISWGSHRLHDSDVIQVLDLLGFRFRMVRMVPMVRRAQVMLRWRPSQLCSLLWGKLSLLSTIDKLTCFSLFFMFFLSELDTQAVPAGNKARSGLPEHLEAFWYFSVLSPCCDLILHTVCNLVPIRRSTHAIILYEYNAVEGQWGSPSIEAKTVWKCLKSVDQGFQTKRQFGICFRTLAGNIRRSSLATSFFIVEASPPPYVRYVTDADVIFNNQNGVLVTVQDFDVLSSLALQFFDRSIYAARIARDGAELLDEEINDLRAVRSVVEQGCDVATLVGIFTLRNGWCVPVDLTLQCGESDMAKDERINRILGNLENLDFAKVISRIRAILPKNDKAEFAEAWNSSGGALRFLVKQIHISNYMSEAQQYQYLRLLAIQCFLFLL